MRHLPATLVMLVLAGCTGSTGPASPAAEAPDVVAPPGGAPSAVDPPGNAPVPEEPPPSGPPAVEPPTSEPAPVEPPSAGPEPVAAARTSLLTSPVPSACGTPVVDGVLSPGEWDAAVSARFGAAVPESAGGGEIPATLQAMSDDVNLYVAIRFGLPTAQFSQSFAVEVDANGDGALSHGDDAFVFGRWEEYPWGGGGDTYFTDAYRWDCLVDGRAAVCAPRDTDLLEGFPPPGTNDGGGAIGFDATSTTVELWHPHRGGDPRDLFASPGDELGIKLFVRFLDCNDWPRCFGDTSYPPYADRLRGLVVGCGAPPAETFVTVRIDVKPGDALPTISLASGGTTSVAILGSPGFDAATVDPAAAYFAGAPVARRQDGSPQASLSDVDGDGRVDAVLHFHTSALALHVGAIEATIAGTTRDGRAFRGTDVVRVIP